MMNFSKVAGVAACAVVLFGIPAWYMLAYAPASSVTSVLLFASLCGMMAASSRMRGYAMDGDSEDSQDELDNDSAEPDMPDYSDSHGLMGAFVSADSGDDT